MARRKKVIDNSSAVPAYIQKTPLLAKTKVTKRGLPSYSEAMLLVHAPEVLRLYWQAICAGLKSRDKTAIEAVGEMFNYVRGKGFNLTLTQQMLNTQVAAGEQAPVKGYDALIRELAERRAGHALPAPPEVIDVTVESSVNVEA